MNDKLENFEIRRVLQEMQEEYWRGIEETAETAAAETKDYLLFRLGGERFGIPSTTAKEVLRLPRLVRVPRIAEHFIGVFNLRGQILAVTDLRPLLGLGRGTPAPGSQLLVTEAAGLQTALLTDRVEGLHSLAVEAIEPMTEGLGSFPRELGEGQVHLDGGLLVLLDLKQILSRPEFVVNEKES